MNMPPTAFSVSVEVDSATGDPLAAYFTVRNGKVAETVEYSHGRVFADYNSKGQLLGFELLGPCNVRIVDTIAKAEESEFRRQTKAFLRKASPRQMVLTG
jgi:uncharacterized protein YuzE